MRPVGALVFGMLADRYGRRIPLMANVIFFSVVELLSGFSPNFTFFLVLRALFGIGMGGEWGSRRIAGDGKRARKWRGVLSGILQSGYSVGYLLAAIAVATSCCRHSAGAGCSGSAGCPRCSRSTSALRVPESEAWKRAPLPSVGEMLRIALQRLEALPAIWWC